MPKEYFECSVCGQLVLRYRSNIRNLETFTCSRKCLGNVYREKLKGENNPNYKNGQHSNLSICECGNVKDYRSSKCAKCSRVGFPKEGATGVRPKAEEFLEIIASSTTMVEVSKKSGISRSLSRVMAHELNADISHFKNSGKRFLTIESLESSKKKIHGISAIACLVREKVKEHKCESCGIGPEWNGSMLSLQIHHINGDSNDNRVCNLKILCPNCHTQTSTFTGRNIKAK